MTREFEFHNETQRMVFSRVGRWLRDWLAGVEVQSALYLGEDAVPSFLFNLRGAVMTVEVHAWREDEANVRCRIGCGGVVAPSAELLSHLLHLNANSGFGSYACFPLKNATAVVFDICLPEATLNCESFHQALARLLEVYEEDAPELARRFGTRALAPLRPQKQ